MFMILFTILDQKTNKKKLVNNWWCWGYSGRSIMSQGGTCLLKVWETLI